MGLAHFVEPFFYHNINFVPEERHNDRVYDKHDLNIPLNPLRDAIQCTKDRTQPRPSETGTAPKSPRFRMVNMP